MTPPTPSPNPGRTTLVASGTKISGRLSGTSEVLVEGMVEGEIRLDSQLVVGTGGEVLGDVSARSVRIAGRITGNVQAEDRVELLPTGSLEGDVTAPRVAIAEGGFCKGRIEMNPLGSQEASAKPEAAAKPGTVERPRAETITAPPATEGRTLFP